MISLLLLCLTARAEPGRFLASGTVGAQPEAGVSLRGTVDYGVTRRVALTAELANTPGEPGLYAGGGLLVTAVDGEWWRIGAVALPEVRVPLGSAGLGWSEEEVRGWSLGLRDLSVTGRLGLRAHYLVFWGLTLTGRVDWSLPAPTPWPELGMGLAIRM